MSKTVAAILAADLHLSEKASVARMAEEDWLAAQERPLLQIAYLQEKHGVPCIFAGDLFDRAAPGPALINWAIDRISNWYGICGNHDLPHGSLDLLKKSAFFTLVKAKRITYLRPGKPVFVGEGGKALALYGFPPGVEPKPLRKPWDVMLGVAVVHKYIWDHKGTCYPTAPVEACVHNDNPQIPLKGYHVAVFGDNHIGFDYISAIAGRARIVNCGGLQRRKTDERDYRPSVGLLHTDGSVERHYLDCSKDKWSDAADVVKGLERNEDAKALAASLNELGDVGIDFPAAIARALDEGKIAPEVRELCLKALESRV
jgi:hypothetical protein